MIGQLFGILLEKQPPQLLLDVRGVGYEIDAPLATFHRLPEIGQEVTLYTHFVVREDAQHLYGFFTREERVLFRTLLKVNGVGPRLALTILSGFEPDDFVRCVRQNDTASLVRVPGIGKKTAERLMIEMRDKLTDWIPVTEPQTSTTSNPNRQQIIQDAISALITLGYKAQEAARMVSTIDDGNFNSAELIRKALRKA